MIIGNAKSIQKPEANTESSILNCSLSKQASDSKSKETWFTHEEIKKIKPTKYTESSANVLYHINVIFALLK